MNEASLQTIFHRLMACCTQLLYDEVEEGRSQKGTLPGIAPLVERFQTSTIGDFVLQTKPHKSNWWQ